jgi:hypothetical protein
MLLKAIALAAIIMAWRFHKRTLWPPILNCAYFLGGIPTAFVKVKSYVKVLKRLL